MPLRFGNSKIKDMDFCEARDKKVFPDISFACPRERKWTHACKFFPDGESIAEFKSTATMW